MHIKRRGRTACLYRSRWVPKGASSNTHGYALQSYVGSLPVDSCAFPEELAGKLTDCERDYVERSICEPARMVDDLARQEAVRRETDPVWRLVEARRLVDEAVERSQRRRVPRDCVQPVADALERVSVFDSVDARQQLHLTNPMLHALTVIQAAAAAVRDGAIGTAPDSGARTTRAYALWSQIVAEIEGTVDNSLLGALQVRGFVKRRRS